MNDTEKCVKCGAAELIEVPIVPGEGPHIAVGTRMLHPVPVTQVVCGNCGYIETWVRGEENLKQLRDTYGG